MNLRGNPHMLITLAARGRSPSQGMALRHRSGKSLMCNVIL